MKGGVRLLWAQAWMSRHATAPQRQQHACMQHARSSTAFSCPAATVIVITDDYTLPAARLVISQPHPAARHSPARPQLCAAARLAATTPAPARQQPAAAAGKLPAQLSSRLAATPQLTPVHRPSASSVCRPGIRTSNDRAAGVTDPPLSPLPPPSSLAPCTRPPCPCTRHSVQPAACSRSSPARALPGNTPRRAAGWDRRRSARRCCHR
jgi:hypothetical protein